MHDGLSRYTLRSFLVATIVVIATLFVVFNTCISKDSTRVNQPVSWSYANGTLTISGTGAMEDYYLKTAPWFSNEEFAESEIKSVVINDGITYIGRCAFMQLTGVESIKLPTSLQVIGENAFAGCSALKAVDFPSGLKKISSGAFSDCTALAEIELPDRIDTLEICCFQGCTSLTKCVISKGVTKIPSYAFETCKALTDITIPEGVTEIEPAAFAFCESLKRVTLPSTLETLGSRKSSYSYAGAFHGCKNLETVNLPDGLKLIGLSTFTGTNLKGKLSIPEGVETVCNGAFTTLEPMDGIVLPKCLTDIEDYFINSKTLVYCSNDWQVNYCKKMNYSYVDTRNTSVEDDTSSSETSEQENEPSSEKSSGNGNDHAEEISTDKEKDPVDNTSTTKENEPVDSAPTTKEKDPTKTTATTESDSLSKDPIASRNEENKTTESIGNTTTKQNSPAAEERTVTPSVAPRKLNKVTGLKCSLNKDLSVNLSWNKIKNAKGYEILRSSKKNTGYKTISVINSSKTIFMIDKKTEGGKTYYYKIRAIAGDKKGSFSEKRSVRIPWIMTPTFTLSKGKTSSGGKCVELKLKKYQGTELEVYVSLNGGSYRKLKFDDNRIGKLGDRIKLSYSKKDQLYSFKIRTLKKIGKVVRKSNYSRIMKIRT